MFRYVSASAAANCFSATPGTRRLYRRIGNVVETQRRLRTGLPERYLERARLLIWLATRYPLCRDGSRVFELGTGFVHFETTVMQLIADVEPTMFDVVDNRLFDVYRAYAAGLLTSFDELGLPDPRRPRAHWVLETIGRSASFDEAYAALGSTYVLAPDGMATLPADHYATVVSADVLEHVDRDLATEVIAETYRILRPGGHAVHQIDLKDHLAYFDPSVSPKHYYHYAEGTWDRWFNSAVQYINRLQRPRWLDLFANAGFEVLWEADLTEPIGSLRVHQAYSTLGRPDLETAAIRIVLRKPVEPLVRCAF